MRSFKAIDWILILGLVGALLVGGVVLATRQGGDNPIDVLPASLQTAVERDREIFDRASSSAAKVNEVYRGTNSWCVEFKAGDTSLLVAYLDGSDIAQWTTLGETYGCQ